MFEEILKLLANTDPKKIVCTINGESIEDFMRRLQEKDTNTGTYGEDEVDSRLVDYLPEEPTTSADPSSEDKFATTYEAPVVKIQDGTTVFEPSSADDLLPDEETTITMDVKKEPDCEIYYLTPYVYNGDCELVADPIEIPFSSCADGKMVAGITDEQLVALLMWRFRFNEERSQIMDQLAQTFYGK